MGNTQIYGGIMRSWSPAALLSCALIGVGGALEAQSVPYWTLAPQPVFSVGTSQTDSFDQLSNVAGAVWLGDHGLVVANLGRELRYYDGSGRYRTTAGRPGEGPGEFALIAWLGSLPGDTLLVFDSRLRRVSVFDPEGELVQVVSLSRTDLGVAPRVWGVLDEGAFLATWTRPAPRGSDTRGLIRDRGQIALHNLSDGVTRIVGEGPISETYLILMGARTRLLRAPFSPAPRYAARMNRVYLADGVTYEVQITDTEGRPLGTARGDKPRIPTTEAVKRATLQTLPAGAEETAREMMEAHDSYPIVESMYIDDRGQIWLRAKGPEAVADHWDVFSPAGAQIAKVRMPPEHRLLDVAEDMAIVLEQGPFGEEIVRAYRLNAP
jgi:hypothetical protein